MGKNGDKIEMNKSITSNLFWKFSERIIAQIVSFVISLVLARLLAPSDYGVVAIVMVFITIVNVFVTNGFGAALIQCKDADDIEFSSVFYFNLCFSLLIYILLFSFAPIIANFYDNKQLTSLVRVLGIHIIFASINSIQQAYVSKKMMFKKFFISTFLGTAISGVVGLVLAYYGCGVWSLVVQYLTNTVIDTMVLFFTIKWKPKLIFSYSKLLQLLKYGWRILFEGLSETIIVQVKNLLIGKVYVSSDLGYYSKAQQFPNLLMSNVSSTIGAVLFSAMSAEQKNLHIVKEIMRKSVAVCTYILIPLLLGLATVSDNMVMVLLGAEWMECVPYIRIFSISMIILIGAYPRHQAMKAIGRSDVYMNEHIIVRIINILLLILFYRNGVLWIAFLEIVNSLLTFLVIVYTSKKYTDYRYNEQVRDVLKPIVISLVMCSVVLLENYIVNNTYLIKLVLQVTSGIFIYIGLSIVLRPVGYEFCKAKLMQILFRKN